MAKLLPPVVERNVDASRYVVCGDDPGRRTEEDERFDASGMGYGGQEAGACDMEGYGDELEGGAVREGVGEVTVMRCRLE